MDDWEAVEDDGAPICGACGVTALPAEASVGFVCENPGCDAFGETVES